MVTQLSRRKALFAMGFGTVGCRAVSQVKAASPQEPVVTIRTTGDACRTEIWDTKGRHVEYVTKLTVIRGENENENVAFLELYNVNVCTGLAGREYGFVHGKEVENVVWVLEPSTRPGEFPRVCDWDGQIVKGATVVGFAADAARIYRFIVECPARIIFEKPAGDSAFANLRS